MPTDLGRKILIVTPGKHDQLALSARNVQRVKVIQAPYLNPEDGLGARHIVFLVDALTKAEEVFGKSSNEKSQKTQATQKTQKTVTKASSGSSASAASSASSKKKEKSESTTTSK